jgi:hypothetical protein
MGKLFGVKAGSVVEYVADCQRGEPKEDQVIWLLRPLTAKEAADIQNRLFQSEGWGKNRREQFLTGTQVILVLRKGLVGFKNFKYEDGAEVGWEDPNIEKTEEGRDRIMDRNLDKIPASIRQELSDQIRGEAELGEAEEQP